MNLKQLILPILVASLFIGCTTATEEKQPNIIVLLVDDAGYADFGFMGCKDLKTPNIDKLASDGVVFTDAHTSASVCGPSRAGLITGRYQQRFGAECNPSKDRDIINLEEKTVADAMKAAGYTTAAFGKWHLGDIDGYKPNQRGFDYYWGFLSGSRNYFFNSKNDVPGGTHSIRENDQYQKFEGYLTDRLADRCVDFIDRTVSAETEKPFFIYWAPNAVHTPMEATEEDLALFEGHPRQKLAAMTWALDRAVGDIINKLKSEDIYDNTLIFFLSDNGGAHNNQSSCLPLKGFKGNEFEGGHRVSFTVTYPDKIKGGSKYDGLTSSLDIFATAVDVSGLKETVGKPLDGVSLIPHLTGVNSNPPHDKLFWRKDQMAASRDGNLKMLRVTDLGYRLYDLDSDIGETRDLSQNSSDKLKKMQSEIQKWDSEMMAPRWTEGEVWDTITWLIHEDLYNNREVDVKNPGDLKKYQEMMKSK